MGFGRLKKCTNNCRCRRKTISFPPIINASVTTVTTKTKNILVEVTSLDKDAAEDMLSVVVAILQMAGFEIIQLTISGKKNCTPKLNSRIIQYDIKLTEQILGLNHKPHLL